MDNFGYEPAHWFNRGKISMKYMLFCIPRTKHGIFEPPGSNRFSKEYSQPLPCPPNSLTGSLGELSNLGLASWRSDRAQIFLTGLDDVAVFYWLHIKRSGGDPNTLRRLALSLSGSPLSSFLTCPMVAASPFLFLSSYLCLGLSSISLSSAS